MHRFPKNIEPETIVWRLLLFTRDASVMLNIYQCICTFWCICLEIALSGQNACKTTSQRFMLNGFLPVSEKGTDDIPGVFGNIHVVREVEGVFMVHNLTVSSHQRVSVEGRVACKQRELAISASLNCWIIKYSLTNKHLKDEDSNRPPVTFSPIIAISSLGLQHLRRDVVRGPDGGITVDHASLHRNRTQESVTFKNLMEVSFRSQDKCNLHTGLWTCLLRSKSHSFIWLFKFKHKASSPLTVSIDAIPVQNYLWQFLGRS